MEIIMTTNIDELETQLLSQLESSNDEQALEDLRVNALGKKGSVSELLKGLGGMSPEQRQEFGPKVNGLKTKLNELINAKKSDLQEAALEARLLSERIDVTLPAAPRRMGCLLYTSRCV